jgi:hypothetical protein
MDFLLSLSANSTSDPSSSFFDISYITETFTITERFHKDTFDTIVYEAIYYLSGIW